MKTGNTGKPGKLYVVATPIGNLSDISNRALETLASVKLIAAEDTRHSKTLLQHYGINTAMMSLHEHNEASRIDQIIRRLQAGDSVALISDAGTPLISDPGFRLVLAVHEAGMLPVPVPGPLCPDPALLVLCYRLPGSQWTGFVLKVFCRQKLPQGASSWKPCRLKVAHWCSMSHLTASAIPCRI
jgi:16S rRNA (cytidine1402-2'-O)-methyltransferase